MSLVSNIVIDNKIYLNKNRNNFDPQYLVQTKHLRHKEEDFSQKKRNLNFLNIYKKKNNKINIDNF